MGLFSSKKKTKETSQQTSNVDRTTSPVVPDWVLEPTRDLAGQIGGLSKVDPSQFVAGSNPLIDQAASIAGGLNSQPWNFNQAADLTRGAGAAGPQSVQAASVLDGLDKYMSPYTSDVVDASLADYDHGAGMTRAQQQLDLANDTTFGGSGGAIARSMTEGEILRGRGAMSANLRDQGFTRGTALASDDAARRQAASLANAQFAETALGRQMDSGKQLADLSTQFGANERANLGAQFDLGQFLRGMNQEQINAPLTMMDFQTSQLAKLNPGLFTGEHTVGTEDVNKTGTTTTTSSPSLLAKLAQAAQIAGTVAAMSDERLKTNIRRIGTRPDGIGSYSFEYAFAPGETHVGVMAQEVQRVRPDAVMVHPSGFLMVDYGRLDS